MSCPNPECTYTTTGSAWWCATCNRAGFTVEVEESPLPKDDFEKIGEMVREHLAGLPGSQERGEMEIYTLGKKRSIRCEGCELTFHSVCLDVPGTWHGITVKGKWHYACCAVCWEAAVRKVPQLKDVYGDKPGSTPLHLLG